MTASKPEETLAVMEYSSWVITMLSNFIIYNTQTNVKQKKPLGVIKCMPHPLNCWEKFPTEDLDWHQFCHLK